MRSPLYQMIVLAFLGGKVQVGFSLSPHTIGNSGWGNILRDLLSPYFETTLMNTSGLFVILETKIRSLTC